MSKFKPQDVRIETSSIAMRPVHNDTTVSLLFDGEVLPKHSTAESDQLDGAEFGENATEHNKDDLNICCNNCDEAESGCEDAGHENNKVTTLNNKLKEVHLDFKKPNFTMTAGTVLNFNQSRNSEEDIKTPYNKNKGTCQLSEQAIQINKLDVQSLTSKYFKASDPKSTEYLQESENVKILKAKPTWDYSKQLQLTLKKSQSLDLYNGENLFLNSCPYVEAHLLPEISTPRTTNINNQSTAFKPSSSEHKFKSVNKPASLTEDEIYHMAAENICVPPPQRPNETPKYKPVESRPIYPNVPYSPYGSPYGSPGSCRRRPALRESRRVSIEKTGSFLQLNQYKLMDQIGQGSYGLVKLAYSEEDSTHYAMKILSKRRLLRQAGLMRRGPKKATSPLDRVYREIAVLKKLDHPNIVKLVEVLDDPLEDSLYMVFELVKQGEVLSIPTDKPLSEERSWCVFRDALLGLEYLHYQKIIHADIKPGNLLLTECGHVKIADLGVCNEFLGENAVMTNGSTAGTPAFRAPETLVLGQMVYCGRGADIWALGATLYALVFGNVPFQATSIPALYEKVKNDDVVFPSEPKISLELRQCLIRMLDKDPVKRITLPELKMNDWVTACGTCPLPTEDENCRLVQVDDEDINSVVRSIPKLDTLILIKTMLKNHSFGNPFMRAISGRAPQRGGSRLERFIRAGRSNSAPGQASIPGHGGTTGLAERCSKQK